MTRKDDSMSDDHKEVEGSASGHGGTNRCGARKSGGGTCGQVAGWGTDHTGYGHCKLHGGSTPNGRTFARLAQAKAEVERLKLPKDVDPHEALLDELRRSLSWVLYLEEQVGDLAERDLTWGQTRWKSGGEDRGRTYEAKPHALYELYVRERKAYLEAAKACANAGVELRRVQIAEEQGRLLFSAINQILEALDLTPEQAGRVPDVVPRVLRSITANHNQEDAS